MNCPDFFAYNTGSDGRARRQLSGNPCFPARQAVPGIRDEPLSCDIVSSLEIVVGHSKSKNVSDVSDVYNILQSQDHPQLARTSRRTSCFTEGGTSSHPPQGVLFRTSPSRATSGPRRFPAQISLADYTDNQLRKGCSIRNLNNYRL